MRTTTRIMRRYTGALVMLLALAMPATVGRAQIPDKFENLKVLPKDISKEELVGIMRKFSFATGFRCNNCHAKDPSGGPRKLNYASDEMELKKKARVMLRMVEAINKKHLPKVAELGRKQVEVQCVTCHRGQDRPHLIDNVLMASYEGGGADSLLAMYTALREEYHGSHTYDFSEMVLIEIGGQLSEKGDNQAAIQVFLHNLNYFPESSWNHVQLAFAYREAGDTASAISSMETAVKFSPDNPWLEKQLSEMRGE